MDCFHDEKYENRLLVRMWTYIHDQDTYRVISFDPVPKEFVMQQLEGVRFKEEDGRTYGCQPLFHGIYHGWGQMVTAEYFQFRIRYAIENNGAGLPSFISPTFDNLQSAYDLVKAFYEASVDDTVDANFHALVSPLATYTTSVDGGRFKMRSTVDQHTDILGPAETVDYYNYTYIRTGPRVPHDIYDTDIKTYNDDTHLWESGITFGNYYTKMSIDGKIYVREGVSGSGVPAHASIVDSIN